MQHRDARTRAHTHTRFGGGGVPLFTGQPHLHLLPPQDVTSLKVCVSKVRGSNLTAKELKLIFKVAGGDE